MIADVCLRNIRERDHLEDLGLDGKIMLECILNNSEACHLRCAI